MTKFTSIIALALSLVACDEASFDADDYNDIEDEEGLSERGIGSASSDECDGVPLGEWGEWTFVKWEYKEELNGERFRYGPAVEQPDQRAFEGHSRKLLIPANSEKEGFITEASETEATATTTTTDASGISGSIGIELPGWDLSVDPEYMYTNKEGHVASRKESSVRGYKGLYKNDTDMDRTCIELDGVDIHVYHTEVERGVRWDTFARSIHERVACWENEEGKLVSKTQTHTGGWEPVTSSGLEWDAWGTLVTTKRTPVFGAYCESGTATDIAYPPRNKD